jgi:hypothetical protein
MVNVDAHPDRIPIICMPAGSHQQLTLGTATQYKFLVQKTLTAPLLTAILRRKLPDAGNKGIFLLVNGIMAPSHVTMEALHRRHKAPDNVLYFTYTAENVFG